MSFLRYRFILSIVILINEIHTSTTITESTTQSIYDEVFDAVSKIGSDMKREEEQLKVGREKLEEEIKQMQKSIETTDVISLNVGGEIIMTTRETLTRVPKSVLSMMFNGRWENKLHGDQNGNIFLDFNPILFRHLLDQLQILDSNNLIHPYPPLQLSLVKPFQKMIHKLGLHQELSLEKKIIHFNVDGHIITNQRTTFHQISNSTFDTILSSSNITKFDDQSDVFVDHHPKLFRHLVKQLREKPVKDICLLEAPSNKDKISFKRMINDFNICQRVLSPASIDINTKWKQNGVTIAGGNRQGDALNQLFNPDGIYVDDDDQCIYIADYSNHRIVRWRYGAENVEVVAGGNGEGDRMDQLNKPIDVIVDKMNDSLIICDRGNRRVVRLSRQDGADGQIIMSDIDCYGLTMDNNGNLYVSDTGKNEVRRWEIGEKNGTIVAGGNEAGDHLNQLNSPSNIFVDEDYSVYVSDSNNHRVMKWLKGAEEGIVVAGGQGAGNSSTQLLNPMGVIVDHLGNVYVADSTNHRIMRWSPESTEGSVIVDGNGEGQEPNQFNYLGSISFDQQGNLYVADWGNHRVQKFDIDIN